MLSTVALAKAPKKNFTMAYADKTKTDLYTIHQVKDGFELQWKRNAFKPKTVQITEAQSNFIREHAVRALWTSKYRAPASSKKCHKYAALNVDGEFETICRENQKATELSYALLNSLRKNF